MRLTYTDLKNQFLRGIQNAASSDSTLLNFMQLKMQDRYQTCFSKMENHTTLVVRTATTTANRQFNHNPPGLGRVETATIDTGSLELPLTIIHSQMEWDRINQYVISGSSFPQFLFPRRDDFGLFPVPGSSSYTITFNGHLRDRSLTIEDYTSGTISLTNNSATLTGSSTTFTAAMVGRWFEVTSATSDGKGIWYRLASFTSTTEMALETTWISSAVSGATYRIGQTPELPEEIHQLIYIGAIADYFAEYKGDIEKATWFNNVFWTGDGNNNSRDPERVGGGLIGASTNYSSRANVVVVKRNPSNRRMTLIDKLNATLPTA